MTKKIVSVQIELAALLGVRKNQIAFLFVSVQIELAALLGDTCGARRKFLVFPSRSNWLPC